MSASYWATRQGSLFTKVVNKALGVVAEDLVLSLVPNLETLFVEARPEAQPGQGLSNAVLFPLVKELYANHLSLTGEFMLPMVVGTGEGSEFGAI